MDCTTERVGVAAQLQTYLGKGGDGGLYRRGGGGRRSAVNFSGGGI